MAWTEVTGNTTTLTAGSTEDSIIAAQTLAGMYVVAIDLNAMVAATVIEVRVYTKVRTGATARVIGRWSFSGIQAEANWQSPPVFVGTGDIAVKIVQSAGTAIAVITTLMADPGGLEPTTAGRKLDVSTGGEAGIDWANIGSPTTSVALTGTTVDLVAATVTGIVTSVWAKAMADMTAVPAATGTVLDAINWLFMLGRNLLTQTATTTTLKKDNSSTTVATATVSDDATTFTRAKWT